MSDVIEYDRYLVDTLLILDRGNGRYLMSSNMTDTCWIRYGYFIGKWWIFDVIEYDRYLVYTLRILDRGNGGCLTSSNMTDTWWTRYGYLIWEMVDTRRHLI